MLRAILSKLRIVSRAGGRPERVSVVLPFLIISIGLGVLAWRSYHLSVRAEVGAKTLAQRYAAFSSEITASRIDTAARAEMALVAEEWQQLEKRIDNPTFRSVRDWLSQHEWIVDAIYVPDFDPASSIYVAELANGKTKNEVRLTREFFTATGSIRYTYAPQRLLTTKNVQAASRQPAAVQNRGEGGVMPIQQAADVTLVTGQAAGMSVLRDGFAAVTPLAAPLSRYGVRAAVRTSYVGGTGWENQRVLSL